MNKKFLIFSGVGDNENQFMSWCENESEVYDRAIFYYGNKKERKNELEKINTEYFFEKRGMIWTNFSKLYKEFFSDYEYVLICDSDLIIDKKNIEETFLLAKKNNFTACSWSRDPKDFGYFTDIMSKFTGQNKITKINFIEMLFMLLRKDVIEILIEDFDKLNLKYATGVDLVLSSSAIKNNFLPFYIINKYSIYNPHPREKEGGREIDKEFKHDPIFLERLDIIGEKMQNHEDYWLIKYVEHEDEKKLRSGFWFNE